MNSAHGCPHAVNVRVGLQFVRLKIIRETAFHCIMAVIELFEPHFYGCNSLFRSLV